MAYKRSVYIEAKNRLSQRRKNAEQEQMVRHSLAAAKCPELIDIESEMASYGASVIKAVGMGADAKEYVENVVAEDFTKNSTEFFASRSISSIVLPFDISRQIEISLPT